MKEEEEIEIEEVWGEEDGLGGCLLPVEEESVELEDGLGESLLPVEEESVELDLGWT